MLNTLNKIIPVFLLAYCIPWILVAQNSVVSSNTIKDLIHKGDNLQLESEYDQAIQKYEQALSLALKTNDSLFRRAGFSSLKLHLENFWDLERAYSLNSLLYEHSCKVSDRLGLIKSTYYYGKIWMYDREDIWALSNFNLALEMLQDTENKAMEWEALTFRAKVLSRINGYDSQLVVNDRKKALAIAGALKDNRPKVLSYVNYAKNYKRVSNDSILFYLKLAKKYCEKTSSDASFLIAYKNIAEIYLQNGAPQKALAVLQENIDFSTLSRDHFFDIHGSCFMTLGQVHKALGNYASAIVNLNTSRALIIKSNNWEKVVRITKTLITLSQLTSDVNKENSELKKLKEFLQKYYDHSLQKEISKTKNEKLLRITEQEITALTEENRAEDIRRSRIQKISYLLGFLVLLSLVLVIFRGVMSKIRLHELNEKINHSRLKSLQATMNPQFLSNSFDTLQHLVVQNNSKGAVAYISKLSGMIRSAMVSSDSLYIHVSDEVEDLRAYIALETEVLRDNFNVVWEIDEKLMAKNPKIPSMVIKPFVENVMVKKNMYKGEHITLKISLRPLKADKIEVLIKDTCSGQRSEANVNKGKLKKSYTPLSSGNFEERLEILRRKSKQKLKIKIKECDDKGSNGTSVQLILPIVVFL